ncbi:MAG: T9SS type A sorting domain-containing protein [Bacteroidota bacterium]
MKNYTQFKLLLAFLSLSLYSTSQEICLVTADFNEATKYQVMWERPADANLYDSVFIYRKRPFYDLFYAKIGSVAMEADSTVITDMSSNTIVKSQYKIAFLKLDGTLTPRSEWHQPMVLNYSGGTLFWTLYAKENQVDETWVASYSAYREDFFGNTFSTFLGTWATQASGSIDYYFDSQATTFPTARYQIEAEVGDCEISYERVNIHTSRSNIKQQFPNEDSTVVINDEVTEDPELSAGIEEQEINFFISPNPLNSFMNILVHPTMLGDEYIICDAAGKIVYRSRVEGIQSSIDTRELQKGTYFFTLKSNELLLSKVFIKN